MRASWIILAFATCTSAHGQSPPPTAQVATPDFTAARQLIRDWVARDSVLGVAFAVARGDSILWEEGFGWADHENRLPVTAQTPFYLASVTKTITATAVMILNAEGRLELDRPANDYLRGGKLWSPVWNPADATVCHLLTHMSGLSTFDLSCPAPQPRCHMPSLEEVIRRYGVLVWPAGEHFDYSNLGYAALGEVVAGAARRDLKTFLREVVYEPLGMTHASLGLPVGSIPQAAVQYSWTRGPIRQPLGLTSGASTAYASAHDLVLFGQLHAKVHRSGVRAILSDAAIDTMQYSIVDAGGQQRYGLGWWVEEDRFGYRSVLAQGGTDASSTWLRLIPSEKIVVVVLANRGVGFPSDVIDAAITAMLPRYGALRAARDSEQARGTGATNGSPAPALDSAFVGSWTGFVLTENGEVPLEFTVTDSGSLRGTIGSRSGEAVGTARFAATLFRIRVAGDLETTDSSDGRQLRFYLRRRNGVFNGLVTTHPLAEPGLDGRVTYWVQLTKRR